MKLVYATLAAAALALSPGLTARAAAAEPAVPAIGLTPVQLAAVDALAAPLDARAAADAPCPVPAGEPIAKLSPKNPWIAGGLNFVLGGAGYIYNWQRPLLGAGLTAGAAGLTFVELSLGTGSPLYLPMFASVFVINTLLAVDAYQEAEAITKMAEWQAQTH